MTIDIEILTQQLREQGPRRFAAWNDDAFAAYLARPVENLKRTLHWRDENVVDSQTVPNYLRMIFEGVGAGWLRSQLDDLPASTFLGHCLWTLVPYQLANVPRDQRSQVLQRVWNLGEGLAREPQWLNQFAITQTEWSTELVDLELHLSKILAPVLSPRSPSAWTGKRCLRILDLREQSEAFVPGRMYLASPSVLCIEDRISPETIAILLQKSEKSELLGTVQRLPEYTEAFDAPDVVTTADAISINGEPTPAPLVTSPRQTLCVASGFVVVSAEDSQRLWLVEVA